MASQVQKTFILQFLLLSFLTAMACGCSTQIKKAEIPSTANPTEEIVLLEQDFNAGFKEHYNILANDDFRKSYSWMKEAKKDLQRGESKEEVLDDVRYGRAYLNRARLTTDSRVGKIENILDARQSAISAGAQSFPDTNETLKLADDRVRKVANELEKLSPIEFSDLQAQYLDIELVAIKNDNLDKARALVTAAINEGATQRAPRTLNKAEIAIKSAENKIEANRNLPPSFEADVNRATAQAMLLSEVMAATVQAGRSINEATALRIVRQNRQITNLNSALKESDSRTRTLGYVVNSQNKQLEVTTSALILQRALDAARAKFTAKEADVYQQDEKLLVRLKSLNFPIGSAVLPRKSYGTLNKVVIVARDLGPSEILIEGHTDAIGSMAVNMDLSQKRADAVANYLEQRGIASEMVRTTGLGFQRPIADNKSAWGRAYNRRVDIVITPINDSSIEQQTMQ